MKSPIIFGCLIAYTIAVSAQSRYFDEMTLAEIKNYPISASLLDGSPSSLKEGDILVFETNEHRRGKMLIRENGVKVVFDWITYGEDGQVFHSGNGSTAKGTIKFDLDGKGNYLKDFDVSFLRYNNQLRSIEPQVGARFAVFKKTKFDIGIKVLEGPESLNLGDDDFQIPLTVAVSSTVRIQAKVILDLVLCKSTAYSEPAQLALVTASYQDGASIPGARIEVDFSNQSRQVLKLSGKLWKDVPIGNYQLIAVIDASDQLHEKNERNNAVSYPVSVVRKGVVPDSDEDESSEAQYEPNYPAPVKKIKLSNNVEIAYVDTGSGDHTLLMIHGLTGYLPVWNKNINELKKHYRCIAIDLPGNGKSSTGDYSFSVQFFSDVLEEFITRLRLKNVVLVGHSFGGQVAIATTLKELPEVKKLVLIAPSGLKDLNKSQIRYWDNLTKPANIKKTSDENLEKLFRAGYANNQIPDDARFMLERRINLKKQEPYFDYFCDMVHKMNVAAVTETFEGQLKDIPIPTLLLLGSEDKVINEPVAEIAKKNIFNCETIFISRCGHMVMWECEAEVNALLHRFARQP